MPPWTNDRGNLLSSQSNLNSEPELKERRCFMATEQAVMEEGICVVTGGSLHVHRHSHVTHEHTQTLFPLMLMSSNSNELAKAEQLFCADL